jgi:hypothetical protein
LFVAQERVELSTAPSLEKDRLMARPVGLRVFLVATGDGYRVMPGGLARVAPEAAGNSSPCSAAAAARTPGSCPKPVEEIHPAAWRHINRGVAPHGK